MSHSFRLCGMLSIGDGFGIHLNTKPSRFHLLMMRLVFGWRWIPDGERQPAVVERRGADR